MINFGKSGGSGSGGSGSDGGGSGSGWKIGASTSLVLTTAKTKVQSSVTSHVGASIFGVVRPPKNMH